MPGEITVEVTLKMCPICGGAPGAIAYPDAVKIYCAGECRKSGNPTEVIAEGTNNNRAAAARLWNALPAKFQDMGDDKHD